MSATDRANRRRLFGPAPPEELAAVARPGDEEDQPPPDLKPELRERLLGDIERAYPSRPPSSG